MRMMEIFFCCLREGANLPKCYSKKQKNNGVVDGQDSLVQKKTDDQKDGYRNPYITCFFWGVDDHH